MNGLCFAQGKSRKGVGYVMAVLVTTARSVNSVLTCLSMAERYNEEMLLQTIVFEAGFKVNGCSRGYLTTY